MTRTRARIVAGLTGLLLAAAAVVAAPLTAHAATLTNHDLPDANLSVSLPDGWAIITPNAVIANPNIVDPASIPAVQQSMTAGNTFAAALDQGIHTEIDVVVVDPQPGAQRVWSFTEYADAYMDTLGAQVASQISTANVAVTYQNSYAAGGQKYLVLSGSQSGDTNYYQQYYTIVNGRMTSIVLHSYTGPLTADQQALLKSIVDTVKFTNITADPDPTLDPQYTPPAPATPTSTSTSAPPTQAAPGTLTNYDLPDANLSVSLPAGWAHFTPTEVLANPQVVDPATIPAVQQAMKTNNAYAAALETGIKTEIDVIVIDPTAGAQRVWNLNEYTGVALEALGKQVASDVSTSSLPLTYEHSYKAGGQTYLVMSATASDGSDQYQQYYTIVNGRMTSIVLHSYAGPLTADQQDLLKSVVDTVKFTNIKADPDPTLDPTHLAKKIGTAVVAGLIIGAVVIIGAIVAIILVVTRNSRKRKAQAQAFAAQPQSWQPAPGVPVPGQPWQPAPAVPVPPSEPIQPWQPAPVPPVDVPPVDVPATPVEAPVVLEPETVVEDLAAEAETAIEDVPPTERP